MTENDKNPDDNGYYPDNVKLSVVAEDWQKSKGMVVPEKGTPEYEAMYKAWVKFAFEGIKKPLIKQERHYCDICDIIFEGEAGKHVNDEHGEDYHSSESMIEFEERHISEVD